MSPANNSKDLALQTRVRGTIEPKGVSGALTNCAARGDPPPQQDSKFGWYGNDADVVVIPGERVIAAVYPNPSGNVVIRQQGDLFDEDVWVVIAPTHAIKLAQAVLAIAAPRVKRTKRVTEEQIPYTEGPEWREATAAALSQKRGSREEAALCLA